MATVYDLFYNALAPQTSNEFPIPSGGTLVVVQVNASTDFEIELQAYNLASDSWFPVPVTDESAVLGTRIRYGGIYKCDVGQHYRIRARLISSDNVVSAKIFISDAKDGPVNASVKFPDRHLDAFGNLRIASPVTLFDSQNTSGSQPVLWENSTTAGGAVTYSNARASVSLSVSTGATDVAIRQTRQYFQYQSGKSQKILFTAVVGSAVLNVTKRLGYFDANNGLLFEQDSNGLYVVRRTCVSGLAVDTRVAQADWNIDPLNGTGISGISLDASKAQIFIIDFEWLGTGSVRFGVVVDGHIYYCHKMRHANVLSVVYMSTPNLPVRFEIRNTASSAGGTLEQICTSVMSEAGFEEERGFLFGVSNGSSGTSVGSGTRTSIVAIRPATNIYGLSNRITILPSDISVVSNQTTLVELVYNPTLSGNPVWQKTDGNSGVEYTITGSTFTGGIVAFAAFVAGAPGALGAQTIDRSVISRLPIFRDINGANPIALSLAVTPSQNATVEGAINWRELY